LIQKVISIAKKASVEIMNIYNSNDYEVDVKSDDSPVTKADLIANRVIIDGLNKISDYPICTEESPIRYETRKNWDRYWLVDPLDGTKNFIAKKGGFTVNIALIENHNPVLGIVYIPVNDDVYHAQLGKGAYKNNKKIFNNSIRSDLIGADSVFHSTKKTQSFFSKNNIHNIETYGSSIKICKLAEGVIDVYPRLNGTKEWDTAASHIIANEAGCKLVDITTNKELIYNKKSIKNNFFIACRNNLSFNTEGILSHSSQKK
jgi:3'(2'), 5'-bisphosphate nucleotidase